MPRNIGFYGDRSEIHGRGKSGKRKRKNPYKWGIKNPKHDRRASCIGDGSNIVLAFEVLISLGARDHETLKTPKPPFFGHSFLGNFGVFLATFGHLRRLFIALFQATSKSRATTDLTRISVVKRGALGKCLISWGKQRSQT
jgi:hypothetical protein